MIILANDCIMTSQNDWVWNAKHTDISSIINDYSGLKMPTCLIRRLQGWRAGIHLCTLVGPTVEDNCCFIFIPVISWRTAFIGINIFHDVISFDFYKSSFRRMLLMLFYMVIEKHVRGDDTDYLQFFSFPLECFKDELSCVFVEVHP